MTSPAADADDAGVLTTSAESMSEEIPASNGLYSERQAEQGRRLFEVKCLECHQALQFNGAKFRSSWEGKPIASLFNAIRYTMPETNPGSLTNEQVSNVIGFMLSLNELPTRTTDLPSEEEPLESLEIQWPASQTNIP